MKNKLQNIKVLHIANTDFFFKYLLLNKLTALREKGMVVHLISPPGKYREFLEQKGFVVRYLPISRKINILGDISSIVKLSACIKREGYQIVHTHTGKGGFVGRFGAWLAGVPIIMHTIHGFSFYEGQKWSRHFLAKFSERTCGWFSYRIFFQNREDFHEVKRTKLINPLIARYIGNGIDIEDVLREADVGRFINYREELQLDERTPTIGFFARLETIKRHEFFLRAFPYVVRKLPNVVCLMAGEGPLEERIRGWVKELSLEKNVRFLGFREDVKRIIPVCDLVVLPSYREGVPRILLEAMLNEKPVVATDVKGNREVVDNYRNGILVNPYDAMSLSRVMSDLLRDGIMMEKMGAAGKRKVLAEFDEKKVVARLLREYELAVEDRL